MENLKLIQLENGLRVVYKPVHTTKIVHCGFMLDIGSRDENSNQKGLAHFWEHMAFKGTQKRKAFHIINSIDSVGGELNAYTTKEKLCFFASVLDKHSEKAFELLTDITFNSIFPELHIEKERNVILEEMSMYKDTPEDAIQDDFEDLVFKKHPMGHNILGTQKSVKSFSRDDFYRFIRENLDTEKVVFSCVGNITEAKLNRLVNKYLEQIPKKDVSRERKGFETYRPQQKIKYKKLNQAHVAIGKTAFPIQHQDRLKLFMLTNILGGPFMNSRLNLSLREKYGFVYNIDSNYSAYTDTGLFSVMYGTEPKQVDKSISLVFKELKKLKEKPLGTLQLHRAKEQIIGQLAMGEENYSGLMLVLGKSILDKGKVEPFESVITKIRNTTAEELQDLSSAFFKEDDFTTLIFTEK
ncbi:MAG: pitrilysin family protein [Bacteroidota bacterium]